MEAAPLPGGWRPALAVAGIPPMAGTQADACLADLDVTEAAMQGPWHGELVGGQDQIYALRLGSWGFGNQVWGGFDLGGLL